MADRRPALLLVGHGSRVPEAATEMAALVAHLRSALPGVTISHGWIELTAPPAAEAGEALFADGHHDVVVVPLLAFAAHHARVDVTAVAARLRSIAPARSVRVADVLGPDPRLLDLAAARVRSVGPVDAAVVVASGSSDQRVQAEIAALAPALAERLSVPVTHAFASLAEPAPGQALAAVGADGDRVALVSWSLLDGRLRRGAVAAAHAAAPGNGRTLIDAGWFGPDPVVAEVLADRYRAVAERRF